MTNFKLAVINSTQLADCAWTTLLPNSVCKVTNTDLIRTLIIASTLWSNAKLNLTPVDDFFESESNASSEIGHIRRSLADMTMWWYVVNAQRLNLLPYLLGPLREDSASIYFNRGSFEARFQLSFASLLPPSLTALVLLALPLTLALSLAKVALPHSFYLRNIDSVFAVFGTVLMMLSESNVALVFTGSGPALPLTSLDSFLEHWEANRIHVIYSSPTIWPLLKNAVYKGPDRVRLLILLKARPPERVRYGSVRAILRDDDKRSSGRPRVAFASSVMASTLTGPHCQVHATRLPSLFLGFIGALTRNASVLQFSVPVGSVICPRPAQAPLRPRPFHQPPRLLQQWAKLCSECGKESALARESVSVSQCSVVFILWAVAVALCLALLALEL